MRDRETRQEKGHVPRDSGRYVDEWMQGYATVAQVVEQLTRNEQVAGSSPAGSSIGTPRK